VADFKTLLSISLENTSSRRVFFASKSCPKTVKRTPTRRLFKIRELYVSRAHAGYALNLKCAKEHEGQRELEGSESEYSQYLQSKIPDLYLTYRIWTDCKAEQVAQC